MPGILQLLLYVGPFGAILTWAVILGIGRSISLYRNRHVPSPSVTYQVRAREL